MGRTFEGRASDLPSCPHAQAGDEQVELGFLALLRICN